MSLAKLPSGQTHCPSEDDILRIITCVKSRNYACDSKRIRSGWESERIEECADEGIRQVKWGISVAVVGGKLPLRDIGTNAQLGEGCSHRRSQLTVE